MLKISYLVTCCSETDTLDRLLSRLESCVKGTTDEVVILLDTAFDQATLEITNKYDKLNPNIRLELHALDNNYGGHKNFGIEKCKGNYIFQLDGDELPPESLLGENLHSLLETNPTIEAFAVPRVNDFRGVSDVHARQWGWRLTLSPTYKRPIVNFPDYQLRIFKRDFPRISFTRKLHEKIEGYSKFVALPDIEEYAIYHDKTIETQIKTNLRYNKEFTEAENRGHAGFS